MLPKINILSKPTHAISLLSHIQSNCARRLIWQRHHYSCLFPPSLLFIPFSLTPTHSCLEYAPFNTFLTRIVSSLARPYSVSPQAIPLHAVTQAGSILLYLYVHHKSLFPTGYGPRYSLSHMSVVGQTFIPARLLIKLQRNVFFTK